MPQSRKRVGKLYLYCFCRKEEEVETTQVVERENKKWREETQSNQHAENQKAGEETQEKSRI